MIIACFQALGNTPVFSNMLKIAARGSAKKTLNFFEYQLDIPSGSLASRCGMLGSLGEHHEEILLVYIGYCMWVSVDPIAGESL